jgi:hypothetical protein
MYISEQYSWYLISHYLRTIELFAGLIEFMISATLSHIISHQFSSSSSAAIFSFARTGYWLAGWLHDPSV